MDALQIRLRDGVTLAVPARLDTITTYVLLEQESWFEKEAAFLAHWLRPGMTAIDIGANLGVYSLPMAARVGPGGRVFAYEPGSGARGLLEQSREINLADSLRISALALSDGEREGRLSFGASSELNALGPGGEGEAVRVTSLDREDAAQGWAAPDFIKIDAEGEEERILQGGRDFFARHSPLVMFEIKSGETVNENLRRDFPAMGYRLYRLVPGAHLLAPVTESEPLDGYELNLFAAKPDRAKSLFDEGVLVEAIAPRQPTKIANSLLKSMPFAQGCSFAGLDLDYEMALAAYATWRETGLAAEARCGALAFACETLSALCARASTPARLSTLARIASDWGRRSLSVAVLQDLAGQLQRPWQFSEPFWPACPRYETIPPGQNPRAWFVASVLEQLERTQAFSTRFGGPTPGLAWLCGQNFASAEMERRLALTAALSGRRPEIPLRLLEAAPGNLNPEIWRSAGPNGLFQTGATSAEAEE